MVDANLMSTWNAPSVFCRDILGEQPVPNLGRNHFHGVVRLFHGKSVASMVGDSIAVIEGPWPAQFPGNLFGFVRLTENAAERVKQSNCTVSD